MHACPLYFNNILVVGSISIYYSMAVAMKVITHKHVYQLS